MKNITIFGAQAGKDARGRSLTGIGQRQAFEPDPNESTITSIGNVRFVIAQEYYLRLDGITFTQEQENSDPRSYFIQ